MTGTRLSELGTLFVLFLRNLVFFSSLLDSKYSLPFLCTFPPVFIARLLSLSFHIFFLFLFISSPLFSYSLQILSSNSLFKMALSSKDRLLLFSFSRLWLRRMSVAQLSPNGMSINSTLDAAARCAEAMAPIDPAEAKAMAMEAMGRDHKKRSQEEITKR